jgi:hypothetical protein
LQTTPRFFLSAPSFALELVLNNFASAIIHSAVFPEYPVRGVEETIIFYVRTRYLESTKRSRWSWQYSLERAGMPKDIKQ